MTAYSTLSIFISYDTRGHDKTYLFISRTEPLREVDGRSILASHFRSSRPCLDLTITLTLVMNNLSERHIFTTGQHMTCWSLSTYIPWDGHPYDVIVLGNHLHPLREPIPFLVKSIDSFPRRGSWFSFSLRSKTCLTHLLSCDFSHIPVARESFPGASCHSVYHYSTPSYFGFTVSRGGQSVSIAPLGTRELVSKPLSLSGARLYYKRPLTHLLEPVSLAGCRRLSISKVWYSSLGLMEMLWDSG